MVANHLELIFSAFPHLDSHRKNITTHFIQSIQQDWRLSEEEIKKFYDNIEKKLEYFDKHYDSSDNQDSESTDQSTEVSSADEEENNKDLKNTDTSRLSILSTSSAGSEDPDFQPDNDEKESTNLASGPVTRSQAKKINATLTSLSTSHIFSHVEQKRKADHGPNDKSDKGNKKPRTPRS